VIIPSMAFNMKYKNKETFPFKHDHDREFSEQGKKFLASQKRHEENIRSGKVVTQPISEYIKVTQNQLDALIRNNKGDTPQANKLRDTIARLEAKQSNE